MLRLALPGVLAHLLAGGAGKDLGRPRLSAPILLGLCARRTTPALSQRADDGAYW